MVCYTSIRNIMATRPSTNTKNHIRDILLLISIPIGLLIVAASYAYVPRILATPKHDFIFASCSEYRCGDLYDVSSNGNITRRVIEPDYLRFSIATSRLYYYDVSNDSTREIHPNDIANYRVDNSSRSPDGYTLEHENGSSNGFLFFYSSKQDGWYLKKDFLKKPVTLPYSDDYYDNRDLQFLGWIK